MHMRFRILLCLGCALLCACDPASQQALTAGAAEQARNSSSGVSGYVQTNLVSDSNQIDAAHHDSNLVNPWGLAFGPDTPAWVADNGGHVATVYDGHGVATSLVVTIPPAGDSAPTGAVFNGSDQFVVSDGTNSGPSRFIFATEDGNITGWSPAVPPPAPSTQAFVVVPAAASDPAIYKGIAIASSGSNLQLYATDFHHSRIDVFDSSFNPVNPSGGFTDPNLPAGYGPFGITTIENLLVVTYAKQDASAEDDEPGAGFGFVDVFDPDGNLNRRLISQGELNAPWGVAMAPQHFGPLSGLLLVGNFGDGIINAYRPFSGQFVGKLSNQNGDPIQIDGLWGLSFGNGAHFQPVNTLFFTAGPGGESQGLYGRLDVFRQNNGQGENDNGDDDQGENNDDQGDNGNGDQGNDD